MNPQHLTPEERRERGERLCGKLCEEVERIAPDGIGTWGPSWETTAPADATFIEALTAWEADPGPSTLEAVRSTWREVLAAWRRAAGEYRSQKASR